MHPREQPRTVQETHGETTIVKCPTCQGPARTVVRAVPRVTTLPTRGGDEPRQQQIAGLTVSEWIARGLGLPSPSSSSSSSLALTPAPIVGGIPVSTLITVGLIVAGAVAITALIVSREGITHAAKEGTKHAGKFASEAARLLAAQRRG